ncbi:hypothetical protein WJX77_001735 [Trebouxia sp. C0004]
MKALHIPIDAVPTNLEHTLNRVAQAVHFIVHMTPWACSPYDVAFQERFGVLPLTPQEKLRSIAQTVEHRTTFRRANDAHWGQKNETILLTGQAQRKACRPDIINMFLVRALVRQRQLFSQDSVIVNRHLAAAAGTALPYGCIKM